MGGSGAEYESERVREGKEGIIGMSEAARLRCGLSEARGHERAFCLSASLSRFLWLSYSTQTDSSVTDLGKYFTGVIDDNALYPIATKGRQYYLFIQHLLNKQNTNFGNTAHSIFLPHLHPHLPCFTSIQT